MCGCGSTLGGLDEAAFHTAAAKKEEPRGTARKGYLTHSAKDIRTLVGHLGADGLRPSMRQGPALNRGRLTPAARDTVRLMIENDMPPTWSCGVCVVERNQAEAAQSAPAFLSRPGAPCDDEAANLGRRISIDDEDARLVKEDLWGTIASEVTQFRGDCLPSVCGERSTTTRMTRSSPTVPMPIRLRRWRCHGSTFI